MKNVFNNSSIEIHSTIQNKILSKKMSPKCSKVLNESTKRIQPGNEFYSLKRTPA